MGDNIHINSPYDRGESAGDLFRGEQHLSAADIPGSKIAQSTGSGDIVGNPAYTLPGQPALINGNGTWAAFFPLSPTYNGLPMGFRGQGNPEGYIYRDTLYYRSDLTPYRESPNYRTLPSSPTTPLDRYRFLDGRSGDVYG